MSILARYDTQRSAIGAAVEQLAAAPVEVQEHRCPACRGHGYRWSRPLRGQIEPYLTVRACPICDGSGESEIDSFTKALLQMSVALGEMGEAIFYNTGLDRMIAWTVLAFERAGTAAEKEQEGDRE